MEANLGGSTLGKQHFLLHPAGASGRDSSTANPSAPWVLVCDDDSSIRAVVQTMLEQQG